MNTKIKGLVAATHTPFHADGQLSLSAIDKQAEHLHRCGLSTVFVGGTTGESHSLSIEERLALAERWSEVVRGSNLRLIVHVGANCLADCRTLAAQAQSIGCSAISALSPSYFKPKTLDVLIDCCADIANAAPKIPFYYYDIPILTGVSFSMPDFLASAKDRIPTLAGIKFTNPDLVAYLKCLQVENGRFDIPWGVDECLLSSLALGSVGAVGSTYNFSAAIYHRLMAAFAKGDLATARAEQLRSIQLIDLLASFGYMAAAKAVMGFLGVEVGPARLPNTNLLPEQRTALRAKLEKLGFFEWVAS